MVQLQVVGGGPLSAASDALLRQALEAALAVARAGEEETPSIPAPVVLRPFLRFAKLPPRALAVARRALELDDEFRARVAEAADESSLGRAGWLFLARPEGWQDELAALAAHAEATADDESERRAEHDARRRLAGAEQATRRAEQAAESARTEAAQAAATLAEERRLRQAATDEAAAAARRAALVAGERDRARVAAAGAAAETASLRRRVVELEAEVRRLEAQATSASSGAEAAWQTEAAPEAEGNRVAEVDAAGLLAATGEEQRAWPDADVGRALREAAAAASRLAEALAAAAVPLVDHHPAPIPPPRSEEPLTAPTPIRSAGRPRAAPGREPVRLPPAIFDDSTEAAGYLVRVSGVVLIVDGYNVSQAGWPEFPIAEQRRRLVAALSELAARTGADVRLVFDGADMSMPGIVPSIGQAVRVSFSAPGVEADDEVLALVEALPPQRPVVVATSDRRVQQGAGRLGANVISSRQLLAALRR